MILFCKIYRVYSKISKIKSLGFYNFRFWVHNNFGLKSIIVLQELDLLQLPTSRSLPTVVPDALNRKYKAQFPVLGKIRRNFNIH